MKKIVTLLIFISIIFPSNILAQTTNKDYFKYNDIFYEVDFSQSISKDHLKTLIDLLQLNNGTLEDQLLNQSNLLINGLALYEMKEMDLTQNIAIEINGLFYFAKSILVEEVPPSITVEIFEDADEEYIVETKTLDSWKDNINADASTLPLSYSTIEQNLEENNSIRDVIDTSSETSESITLENINTNPITNEIEEIEVLPITTKEVKVIEVAPITKEVITKKISPSTNELSNEEEKIKTSEVASETQNEENSKKFALHVPTDNTDNTTKEQSASPVEKLIASEFIQLEQHKDDFSYLAFISIISFLLLTYLIIIKYIKLLKK